MLPETGEVILKWLPYVGVGLIVLVILVVLLKRKNNKN
ncbi:MULTISPECIES: LPXTG cell wall anchor domain-containing protein [Enterococcus]|nr:LPXTG cell wall anchor domain-containing protein [Enterococcus faecalis]